MATTARISEKSNVLLEELINITGKSKIEIIEDALRTFVHYEKMKRLRESFHRLRQNKTVWNEEMRDRKELDGTLMDGLDEE